MMRGAGKDGIETPGLRSIALGAAALGALSFGPSGCASIRETHSEQVLESRIVIVDQNWLPELDDVSAAAHVHGSEVRISAKRTQRCVQRSERQEIILHRENDELGEGGYALDLVALSLGGAMTVAGLAENSDQSGGGTVVAVLGIGVALGGLIALAIDSGRTGVTETRRLVRSPDEEKIDDCRGSPRLRSIALVLPDGSAFAARPDAHGRVRIWIPDEVWTSRGGTLEADLWIDGLPVRRLFLTRSSAGSP